MNRTLVGTVLLLALVVLLGVVLMWYLALGSSGLGDQTIESSFVSQPSIVTVGGGFEIDAANESEAYYLLGYTQGLSHPWTLCLLRQTALGRLSEWFEEPTVPIDRLTRSLAIPTGARSGVQRMDADHRRALESFARGVTDAFARREVLMNEQLVLFGIVPEPWEDWHAIAVERLFAWLSEAPIRPAAGDTAFIALKTFQEADEALRTWLHVHGLEHSSVWSIDDSTGTIVQAQFVAGASALPVFVPARLSWPGARVDGVSLLGTPIFTMSVGSGGAFVTLLSSPRASSNRFAAGYPDSIATNLRYERIVLGSGAEHLVTIPHLDGRFFFSSSSLRSDLPGAKYWGTLAWTGFRQLTDWPAWHNLTLRSAGIARDGDGGFTLIDGVGIATDPGGRVQVRGRPVVEERTDPSSVFLAIHPLGRYAAHRFRSLAPMRSAGLLTSDVVSPWAEVNVETALNAVGDDSMMSGAVREAVDYLRNWDHRYDLASIGAPIFDAWMGALTRHADPYPTITVPVDSLGRVEAVSRLRGALETAVDSLVGIAGPDLARWRLEAFRTGERFYPVWSSDALQDDLPPVNPRRYAPLSIQQTGHPTTVAWESGLFDYPRNSPAHVVARAAVGAVPSFSFRPDYRIGTGLIARHVIAAPEERPSPFPTRDEAARLNFRPSN